jgi:hypothetical protein
MIVGDDDNSWNRPIAAGTSHALFIEDNSFKQTNAAGGGLNENIYHQEGARTVIRHNDFDCTQYTSYDAALIDSHGNQGYYSGPGSIIRGQPLIEVYDNTFRYHHTYRVSDFRGGSILFHDNTFAYVTYSDTEFQLWEEEGWHTAFFSPLRTVWPAEDQIMNSFFWNNTLNGSQITDVSTYDPADQIFIQKDRDYFMHPPAATGGKETYPGRPGAADMTFSPAGPNAYYPYTAYVYPHPLQGAAAGPLGAPTGLRIK